MRLHIDNTVIKIQLDWQERLWAFHLSPTIEISITHILRATTETPTMEWYALRAPGTALPGFFVAGTYYTKRGREFWYVTQSSKFLVLDVEDEYYKRVVLTLDDHLRYANQLNEMINESTNEWIH